MIVAICIMAFVLLLAIMATLALTMICLDLRHALTVRQENHVPPTVAHDSLSGVVREHFLVGTRNGVWSVPNGPDVFALLKEMEFKLSPEQSLLVAKLAVQLRLAVAHHEKKMPRLTIYNDDGQYRMVPSNN